MQLKDIHHIFYRSGWRDGGSVMTMTLFSSLTNIQHVFLGNLLLHQLSYLPLSTTALLYTAIFYCFHIIATENFTQYSCQGIIYFHYSSNGEVESAKEKKQIARAKSPPLPCVLISTSMPQPKPCYWKTQNLQQIPLH